MREREIESERERMKEWKRRGIRLRHDLEKKEKEKHILKKYLEKGLRKPSDQIAEEMWDKKTICPGFLFLWSNYSKLLLYTFIFC